MARWTTKDIPGLTGRKAVVTGANSGLGYETSLALARAGATVVLACRDEAKGALAIERIKTKKPDADVRLESLDLANLKSVREFASGIADRHEGIDILVNNAGVMAIPRRETADGFEMQFGTNHLGHFALTGLLMNELLARSGSRILNVSSEVARIGRIKFDDLQSTRRYSKWIAYAQTKLANQLFTLELDRRFASKGLISVAAHPGYAATNLQGLGPQMTGSKFMQRMTDLENAVFAQSAAMGALPTLYAVTNPTVRGAQYFGPDQLFGTRGYPKQVSFVPQARSTETAERLWSVSEELTGVRIPH
ncbi:MAG: oxidoreductase [Acidimicrobiales bacterium]